MNTDMIRNDINNQVIDLGLSVLWASKNMGDSLVGNYYSWGKLYPWECENLYYWNFENPINNICGNADFDVARYEYGKPWRLPTASEFEELIQCCKWTWEEAGDITPFMAGYKVYGPNGNHIFLPAAGYGHGTVREESYVTDQDIYGMYWSGNLSDDKAMSYELFFRKENICIDQEWRSRGNSIRPVCER